MSIVLPCVDICAVDNVMAGTLGHQIEDDKFLGFEIKRSKPVAEYMATNCFYCSLTLYNGNKKQQHQLLPLNSFENSPLNSNNK